MHFFFLLILALQNVLRFFFSYQILDDTNLVTHFVQEVYCFCAGGSSTINGESTSKIHDQSFLFLSKEINFKVCLAFFFCYNEKQTLIVVIVWVAATIVMMLMDVYRIEQWDRIVK